MSSSLLKIHYDFSNELSQKEFFLGNLSQQFRSYYIGKGNPTAQYYQNWYTNQDISAENTLFVDPDISSYQAQQTYFSDNDNELLKGYYIAQNAQSISVFSYFSTPMFELNLDYSSLATDNPLIGHILEAKTIVESIIKHSPTAPATITISETLININNVLGSADYASRTIEINTLNSSITNTYSLNNIQKHINLLVLVHEIIHIIGVGTDPIWTTNVTDFFYTGENGFREYKQLLHDLGYDITGITGVPVENDFGSGTQRSHFEEGIDGNWAVETRTDAAGKVHPTIPTEIMTGFLDDDNGTINGNFITRMTLGILEDIGYTVDYNSEHCVNAVSYQL
tara:strand:+ start:11165 stop:12181 length:1017 start_codon:yes stop_codon:yes gene_type:complete